MEVQDGILEGAAGMLTRMGELKSLSQDVLKNASDKANYNAEFQSLQEQLYQIGNENFNGVSLFATTAEVKGSTQAVFGGNNTVDHTVSIYTSERGSAGSLVSINKSALLSAVTFTSTTSLTEVAWVANGAAVTTKSFAADTAANTVNLDDLGVSFFTQALENIATLRADNGGTTSRLNFALEHANRAQSNLEAANGRIVDVDIAAESTRLAKYNILVQASASMLSQANVAPNAALMLLS